jgi:hypothetical protein
MRTFSPNVGARTRRQRREANHAREFDTAASVFWRRRGVRGWQRIGTPNLVALLSSTQCVCLRKRPTVCFFDLPYGVSAVVSHLHFWDATLQFTIC